MLNQIPKAVQSTDPSNVSEVEWVWDTWRVSSAARFLEAGAGPFASRSGPLWDEVGDQFAAGL